MLDGTGFSSIIVSMRFLSEINSLEFLLTYLAMLLGRLQLLVFIGAGSKCMDFRFLFRSSRDFSSSEEDGGEELYLFRFLFLFFDVTFFPFLCFFFFESELLSEMDEVDDELLPVDVEESDEETRF